MRLRGIALPAAAVIALLGLSEWLLAQQPVFRSGIDLVTVDTLVVDDKGRPVTGLEADDFEILVDGQPRPVQAVEFLEFETTDPAQPAGPAPEVSTNETATSGRLVLLVVDRSHIRLGEGRQSMESLAGFVRQLPREDRVGLFALPEGGPLIDPTSNHERIITALEGLRGLEERHSDPQVSLTASEALRIERGDPTTTTQATERNCLGQSGAWNSEGSTPLGRIPYRPPTPESSRFVDLCQNRVLQEARRLAAEARANATTTVATLGRLIEAFRYVEGPKTILFVSEGLATDAELRGRLRDLGSTAAASSIALYAVQMYVPPMDGTQSNMRPDWDEDRTLRAESLSQITGVSGGGLFRPAGPGTGVFAQIAREMSARYVLSFAVRPEERDGKPHQIAVRVKSRARVVRHRTEFVLPSTPARFAQTVDTLPGAISAPLPLRALALRVGTYVVPEAGSDMKVLIAAEIGRAGDSPRQGQLAYEVTDVGGRILARGSDLLPAADRPEGLPLRHASAIRLAPGQYWLKLAAKDETGRLGSVEHPFDVQPAGTLDVALGSLMLFRTVNAGDAPRPELVFDLAPRDGTFGAHFIAHAPRAAVLDELSAVLEVTDAREQVTRYNRRMEAIEGAVPEQRGFEARVPVRHWPAGHYLAQVTVLREGRRIGRLSRSLILHDAAVLEGADDSGANGAGSTVAPPLASRLELATGYVERYAAQLASTVAEERYVQAILDGETDPSVPTPPEALAWSEAPRARTAGWPGVAARRQLRSDLLMVKTSGGWFTNFRDVADVDGRPVKDRDERALALFTGDAAQNGATLRRIAHEGARYNLGTLRRTINVPTLPLFALHPQHVKRFSFEQAGIEAVDGVPTVVVRFRERHIPTLIRTPRGDDVFTAGRLWIAEDGRVLRSALSIQERASGMQAGIDVWYRDVPSLGLLMPAEMRERYSNVPGDDRRVIEARATYSNFRKFTVTTEEK